MTENDSLNISPEEKEKIQAAYAALPETMLSRVASLATNADLPITLTTPGATFTGRLISPQDFFESQRDLMRTAVLHGDGDSAAEDGIRDMIDMELTVPEEKDLTDAEYCMPRRFIHLKEVSMIGNGYTLIRPYQPGFIRIPLAHVTSWHLGWID